ncbi:hypothetical protein [Pseudomonas fluorescens]|uniref:Uncharacterized protein n=1 Tax=Pseudomonas fluorescens TaxID=294 RepID=A0A944HBR9_PSEFL|nr:hypothetical protein [Pseudomonas fluorescens]MBT2297239.1 hypothetical protein [Pseudomonas fluorescens]MBT2306439.1 hypothetical protein [Pseudomonas fluorescens]MBT2315240.1 hypothetical protein [Pseudomonas fluorescens]MBT2318859.1 hypothetical protein [Pseudomonas fluorescens]MBT2328406.1 hypothetical protein [Pseudomonas fluorescens]
MASANKQQKRAKRAKAKAKQARVSRTKPSTVTFDLPEYDDPYFLDALQDEFAERPRDFLSLFYEMHDAEEESGRIDMMVRMLGLLLAMTSEQPELLDNEDAESEAMAVQSLAENTLIAYRKWADDIDQEAAEHWFHSPEVQADFETARASFKELLKILWDLEDAPE